MVDMKRSYHSDTDGALETEVHSPIGDASRRCRVRHAYEGTARPSERVMGVEPTTSSLESWTAPSPLTRLSCACISISNAASSRNAPVARRPLLHADACRSTVFR